MLPSSCSVTNHKLGLFNRLIAAMLAIYLPQNQHSFFSFKDLFTVNFLFFRVNFIKLFFCLKPMLISVLVINSLLTLSINSAYALNASTVNVINGSAPYLTYDGGITKADSTESLLGITLSDGTVINALNDESSLVTPIELPSEGDTYASIQTIVPLPAAGNSSYPRVNIIDLLKAPYNYFGDDDGDGYDDVTGEVIATASGDIGVKWENINGIDVTDTVKNNAYSKFIECDSPYKLTLTTSNVELNTVYGEPNKSSFMGSSHSYYINPKVEPHVCYAQPSPLYDDGSSGVGMLYDGPGWDSALIDWNYRGYPSKGFKINSARNSGNYDGESSVYKNNFPSTGSNGLYFYLLLAGISPEAVITANGSNISAVEGGNVSLSLSTGITQWENDSTFLFNNAIMYPYQFPLYGVPQKGLKITLNGPRATSNDKSFSPSTFRLYADSRKSKILYEFKLMRWYIPTDIVYNDILIKGDLSASQSKGEEACRRLGKGYRLTGMYDLTYDVFKEKWHGIPPTDNYTHRQLSYRKDGEWVRGIMNEWGSLYNNNVFSDTRNYPDSDWVHQVYGIEDPLPGINDDKNIRIPSVNIYNGSVLSGPKVSYLACVSP